MPSLYDWNIVESGIQYYNLNLSYVFCHNTETVLLLFAE